MHSHYAQSAMHTHCAASSFNKLFSTKHGAILVCTPPLLMWVQGFHVKHSVAQCTLPYKYLSSCMFAAGVLRGSGVPQREHIIRRGLIHSEGS